MPLASPCRKDFTHCIATQAVAARALGLLSEDPTPTFKQLVKSILRLNGLPGLMRLRQEDINDHAAFVADQLGNTEGLASCKVCVSLCLALNLRFGRKTAISHLDLLAHCVMSLLTSSRPQSHAVLRSACGFRCTA